MNGATMVVATIPVSNLERSGTFYGETLGLERLWANPVSIRFRCGPSSELSVFKRPVAWFRDPDGHFLGLRQG